MAILEFAAQTILRYKADVSDAKKGLRELQGEEKKLAAERIKAMEAENEALKKRAERFQFMAAAIGATVATVAVARAGMAAYAKTSDEAREKVERVNESVSKGMNELMVSIGKLVVAFEPLIAQLGKVAEKAAEVITIVADGWSEIFGIGDSWRDARREYARTGDVIENWLASGNAVADYVESHRRRIASSSDAAAEQSRLYGAGEYSAGMFADDSLERIEAADARRRTEEERRRRLWGDRNRSKGGAPRPGRWGDVAFNPYLDYTDFGERIGRPTASTGLLGARSETSLVDQFGRSIDPLDQFLREQVERNTQSWNERLAAAREKRTSFLESTFGPIEEFNLYGKAFETLTGGVTSAMDAWITGSASATDAIKAFLAETIKGLAIQMTVEAIKHGAYALGSLAFGDAKGAASHGMAAAKFAAGAVIATGLAKGMYGAGWAGGDSAGAGANPGAPSTGGAPAAMQPAAPTHVVVYEDSFADASAHERQLRAERTIRRVSGSRAVRDR